MSNFDPGKIVSTFIAKDNSNVTIRYPQWSDLDQLLIFINKLSEEHTFIRFSGEKISAEEESKFLADGFAEIEQGDKLFLVAEAKGNIIGSADVKRNTFNMRRSLHVGEFSISLSQDYRGLGIGYQLAQTVIAEAQKRMPNLSLLTLTVYEGNEKAQNLYKKLGFIPCGEIPHHILHQGKLVSEFLMYKELVS